ncbi:Conidial pigment biosynthesis oxidase abr2 [Hyphodiscus hymeniophilus]|uniref:Conidial pigment biosynthesis oxidase abr2 n=1 Tax=Hyphodiscus hymeniophilus TaxID=353542 RepID=A0A9P6VR54_9HELO|nr:Conidial pigment biosynthesis oxidase abr2 [Hyphodiscus hymeniophilus]
MRMRYSRFSLGLLVSSLATRAFAFGNVPVVFPVALTWGKGSPDGFERDMIFVNGQMPGPTLNLEEGDDVEFIVTNWLPFGTTVHFHGIEQINTPWSDGMPGLSQRLIEPGATFKYKWTATQYGTYWYHAHSRGQLEDGLFGAIHIKPKENTSTPFSLISKSTKDVNDMELAAANPEIAVMSDWSHFTSEELQHIAETADIDIFCGDSMLINGKGNVNCPGVPFLMSVLPPIVLPLLAGENLTDKGCVPVTVGQPPFPKNLNAVPSNLYEGCKATNTGPYVFNVDASKGWVSLNFISTAAIQEMAVSIDEHPMWVYEIDGRFIEPQMVDAITLQHGSRHSVMVELNKPAKDYHIRVAGTGLGQKIYVSGLLSYNRGTKNSNSQPYINYAGTNTTADVTYLDDTTIVPFPPVHPAQTADQTYKLVMGRAGYSWQWSLDGTAPYNESLEDITPLLFDPNQLANTNLTITTKNDTWVDLIYIVNTAGGPEPPHPIHKHSNKAHIIGSGQGDFTWTNVAEAIKDIPESFNLDNPPYRDMAYTLLALADPTWVAVRYHVVNPGAFFLHCHIQTHLTGGMSVAILDGIDAWPKVPAEYQQGRNGF